MTHTWPQLRRFCRTRRVDFVEVDLRWGIPEKHLQTKAMLRTLLHEIDRCTYFIAFLGERYGEAPTEDQFTFDLEEEQPWLRGLHGRSFTELEISRGVLNSPAVAGRSFIYFRDPEFLHTVPDARKGDLSPVDVTSFKKLEVLKEQIRNTCAEYDIPLVEAYSDPSALAERVLEDLKAAIGKQFPEEAISDPIARDARDHESYAEIHRRVYIARPSDFDALDSHCLDDDGPLVLLGESGCGKSALVANWIAVWRDKHKHDHVFQHYIGCTSDSAQYMNVIIRLVTEIRQWCKDERELPKSSDEVLRDFPVWLSMARFKAEREGVRFIVVLDALDQLEVDDNANLLAWMPTDTFRGHLRLIVTTLVGPSFTVLQARRWKQKKLDSMSVVWRRQLIQEYLARCGKALDADSVDRLSEASASANPLYLRILLDELRVTGTHEDLGDRLTAYLRAEDVSSLLEVVLSRFECDYESTRKGLVGDALGLIWAARRGLTESELLRVLRPADLSQLPQAIWAPMRAALEEMLVDRSGVLGFSHQSLRAAIERRFVTTEATAQQRGQQLADFFEQEEDWSERKIEELPWQLDRIHEWERLHRVLIDEACFQGVMDRDAMELLSYWRHFPKSYDMIGSYNIAYQQWKSRRTSGAAFAGVAFTLGVFFRMAGNLESAEQKMRHAVYCVESTLGKNHPTLGSYLSTLASVCTESGRLNDANEFLKRSLNILDGQLPPSHPSVFQAYNNAARLLLAADQLEQAETIARRAVNGAKEHRGPDHHEVAEVLTTLALILHKEDHFEPAESALRLALEIEERTFSLTDPHVALCLNNLGMLLSRMGRNKEAEEMLHRALLIDEAAYDRSSPLLISTLSNLAEVFVASGRGREAEAGFSRAIRILERSAGPADVRLGTLLNNLACVVQNDKRFDEAEELFIRSLDADVTHLPSEHSDIVSHLNNYSTLLRDTNRPSKAEEVIRRAIGMCEKLRGSNHTELALVLNTLGQILHDQKKYTEAEAVMRRVLDIYRGVFGKWHPRVAMALNNIAMLLVDLERPKEAEPLVRSALEIHRRLPSASLSDTGMCLFNLAVLLTKIESSDDAVGYFEESIDVFLRCSKANGAEHPALSPVVENYLGTLQELGVSQEERYLRLRKIASDCGVILRLPNSQ